MAPSQTNILIKNGASPQACISDFSSSAITPTMSFATPNSVDGHKGTRSHMAPELLLPTKFGRLNGQVSKQTDVYAFGVVVYEVLVGHTPFSDEGRGTVEIATLIIEGKRASKPGKADDIGFGEGTWELVQRCWHEDQDKRPTVEHIRQHFEHVAGTSAAILLRRWRGLPSRNLKPSDHQRIANLVNIKGSREITLNFRGEDAAIVIKIIDKVIQFQPIMPTTTTHSIHQSQSC